MRNSVAGRTVVFCLMITCLLFTLLLTSDQSWFSAKALEGCKKSADSGRACRLHAAGESRRLRSDFTVKESVMENHYFPSNRAFVVYNGVDESVCREASVEEVKKLTASARRDDLRNIKPAYEGRFNRRDFQSSARMKIQLRGTSQLNSFPQARDAFLRAAAVWENLIGSPISIVLDVDFGPTRFGAPYPAGVIGATDPQEIEGSSYANVRSRLISAANGNDAALYQALPANFLPTDIGASSQVSSPSALLRALGLLSSIANPDQELATLGAPPSIGFNSNYQFDFNPDDGIGEGQVDFTAVAMHEIGHALGFTSNAGLKELSPSLPVSVTVWDLFRFRPGINLGTYSQTHRILSSGGTQLFFAGDVEAQLSTGRPDGSGGDERQASHWKDDDLNFGQYLGIMDPTIATGRRESITNLDVRALDLFGYQPPQALSGPAQSIVPLTSGTPFNGTIEGSGGVNSCVLGPTQYTINVPSGATQLQINLNGNQDVDLFARFGQAVAISNGQAVADYRATTTSNNETITITGNSSPPLQSGTYFIAVSNCSLNFANFTLTATVTGPGGGTNTVELSVDDGSLEDALGAVSGGTTTAVNRLTPTAYPATINAVRIYFRSGSGISVGTTFSIQVGSNPDGDANIDGTPFQPTSATVQALDQFVTYTVPNVTINSGDFVVGFRITVPNGVFPFTYDTTPPSRGRSYVSSGGSFSTIDSLGLPGNFAFRALVNIPQPCTYSITPTSQFFNANGGPGSVSVSVPAGCAWTATSNSSFITINSGAAGSGNGTVVYTVATNQAPVQRNGTMTIAGQTFTVTQEAGTPNTIPLVSGVTQSGSIPAASAGACLLGATQYTIQVPSGSTQLGIVLSGNQNVNLHARFNQSVSIVNGVIVDDYRSTSSGNNESLTITAGSAPPLQAGTYFIGVNNCSAAAASFTLTATVSSTPPCSYSISPASQNFLGSGGTGTVGVNTTSGCSWTATSNAPWLTITSGATGSGSGSVVYSVAANNTTNQRTGTMNIAGQIFTVTQDAPVQTARTVRLVSTDGVQGGFVNVPIELVSLSDENTIAFSLNFNPAVLSNPMATLGDGIPASTALLINDSQKAQGRFGASLQLPVNQTVVSGTRRILFVRFDVAPNPNLTTTEISFGDQPISRVVGNVQANSLPANYTPGTITILPGWEADVHPRPTGSNDGNVTPLDAAQVGRFAAGLDTPNNGNEFQRADCAPRADKGNGIINALDWAQAARFAAALDSVATAGGPSNPVPALAELFLAELIQNTESAAPEQQRVIRVVNTSAQPGGAANVVIRLDAQGMENVFSFSLNFDPTILSFTAVTAANTLPAGSQLTVNQNQAQQGRLGILLLLPPGQGIGAGSRDLVNVGFNVAANVSAASTPITFGNQPIARLVGDKDLNDLTASTTFTDGVVTIGSQGNPVPVISSISPSSAQAGGAAFTLTVNGSSFVNGATVNWNGSSRATTFVSGTQLTASILAGDIAAPGTVNVTVTNPAPGGGTSNALQFTINQIQTTARTVRVVAASGAPGATVTVPIELVAQGDESGVGFSLTFDPAVLSNPQVMAGNDAGAASLNSNTSQSGQGKVGVLLALSAGQAFTAGVKQIVKVTFTIAANANAMTTNLGFVDQPIAREVSNVAAAVLPVNFVGGAVQITQGYEADVAPRPNGNNNGTVTLTDWVQVGRFVAGLDTANVGSEFQRADVAPKDSLGDGRLSVSDLTQAGRYAAGLDAVVPAGGPMAPSGSLVETDLSLRQQTDASGQIARDIRIVAQSLERGQNGSVAIAFDAQGGENAISFSFAFEASQLKFLSASVGKDAGGAALVVNTTQEANGRIGVVLALPGGQAFQAGARELVVLNFNAVSGGNPLMTNLEFADQPVAREMADVAAAVLPVKFTGGSVKITRTAVSVSAASYLGANLASDAITAIFGSNLATAIHVADSLPLPTQLGGTMVKVKDSVGIERLAPLFFVAPNQINYLMPAGMPSGDAEITVISGDGTISNGKASIALVAPALFSANSSGQGVAAATVLRVKADGSQVYEAVSRFDASLNRAVSVPIDLGAESDQVYLILFGTGLRFRSSLSASALQVGGIPVEVLYAGPQGDFAGLDQINLRLPRNLAGRGEVQIKLSIDGKNANAVTINVK